MKPLILVMFFLLTLPTVSGQVVINNVLTAEHQNVAGTKISLVPPKGFIKADSFSGFQQKQNWCSIMILDIPGPFSETANELTKERLLTKNIEVKEIENLTVNKLPAILVSAEQELYGTVFTKYVLCFGTDKETIMINGSAPSNLNEIAKEIKKSILTSYYEEGKKIDPYEDIDYKIDISKSKLLFASSMSGSMIYTSDGLIPIKSSDKTSLIISKSFSTGGIADTKQFALNRLKQFPVDITEIESTLETTIDGIPGYEIISASRDRKTSEPRKIYLVMLFEKDSYYLFYGSTNQNFDVNINGLRQVVKTFKRK